MNNQPIAPSNRSTSIDGGSIRILRTHTSCVSSALSALEWAGRRVLRSCRLLLSQDPPVPPYESHISFVKIDTRY